MKKFDKIQRVTTDILKSFNGDLNITISEKIDGANASFQVNTDGSFTAFSRRTKLNENDTLRGFYDEVEENLLPKVMSNQNNPAIQEFLQEDYTLFGEWLVPHAVRYQDEFWKHFYPFAVYDNVNEQYLSEDFIDELSRVLGLNRPPQLYTGELSGVKDKLESLPGTSNMSKELNHGEGIVIVFEDLLNKPEETRFKIVTDEFLEHKQVKKNKKLPFTSTWVNQFITSGRVNKIIYKAVDEGLFKDIPIEFKNFKQIVTPINENVLFDILEEELTPDGFDMDDAVKAVNKGVPRYVRDFIQSELDKNITIK